MAKMLVVGLTVLLFGPATVLLGLGAAFNPAAQASCLPSHADASTQAGSKASALPETARVVVPLPAGEGVRTSGFGMRVHPITGETKLHTGVDFSAPGGTHILAAADGRVVFAGPATGYGHWIVIEHTLDGQRVATGYAHMYADGLHVAVGDTVSAGQYIADVGSDGYSTGAHLHFEVRPGGADAAPVDPEPWLAAQRAVATGTGQAEPPRASGLPGAVQAATEAGCTSTVGTASSYPGENPGGLVDDPTSNGRITQRTAHVLAQLRGNFPDPAWSCWSERPGNTSEHEIGRACDGTFGNVIGIPATGPSLDLGWKVTNWLKSNAETLGVEYLIWRGRIWSVARRAEGWRPYDGGGMHDPGNVSGGHYDHLHVTVEP